jgi:hypothetical protein
MPISPEVLPADQSLTPITPGIAEAMERGAIDIQIRTAKAYPRSIDAFLKQLETYATLNAEIAASCSYLLKRKDDTEKDGVKKIQGPSIRFAELLVATWGHMRVAGITVDEDARFVTLRGMAWDLEVNSAFSVDVKRRITTKKGHTYSDDMIGVTSNAGISIATRNAILHVVPKAFWWPVYEKCLVVARGDARTLKERWARVLEYFKAEHGKTPADLYGYLGIRGEADVTLDHLEDLQGLRTAVKDGETTIEEAFASGKGGAVVAPEEVIASELDCSPAIAFAVLAGFVALQTPPAQRTVLLKKHKGQGEAFLQQLRDMSGQALPVPVDPPAAAGETSAGNSEPARTQAADATVASQSPSESAPAASSTSAAAPRAQGAVSI